MRETRKEADRIVRRMSDLESNDKEKILGMVKKTGFYEDRLISCIISRHYERT
jgi:hypothetical protein